MAIQPWKRQCPAHTLKCFYGNMAKEMHDELKDVYHSIAPGLDWAPDQCQVMLSHFVHFLELKVILRDYHPGEMLAPSAVMDQMWRGVILETQLYESLTYAIQDHYNKDHAMIHHSVRTKNNESASDRFDRTRKLFRDFFGENMLGTGASSAATAGPQNSATLRNSNVRVAEDVTH